MKQTWIVAQYTKCSAGCMFPQVGSVTYAQTFPMLHSTPRPRSLVHMDIFFSFSAHWLGIMDSSDDSIVSKEERMVKGKKQIPAMATWVRKKKGWEGTRGGQVKKGKGMYMNSLAYYDETRTLYYMFVSPTHVLPKTCHVQ